MASIALSDLAKFCRYADAPTRHDATGRVDVSATMEAVGMHKLYRRICVLLMLDDSRAAKLALMQWQQSDDDDEGVDHER